MRPTTKFAKLGNDRIGYQVLGESPVDLIFLTGMSSHVDLRWEEPLNEYFLHRLASFTRLILFDRRGTGVSGPGAVRPSSHMGRVGRAIRAAGAIQESIRSLGIDIRAGLHAGEIELREGRHRVGGIAVHIAARVMATAAPGEILVSSTVKDLVAGSGIEFRDRGTHDLKGVPGGWRLFVVEGARPKPP